MQVITKLEHTILGWIKSVPHLPRSGQKWLADNAWWIVLIGAILSALSFLFGLGGLLTLIALQGNASSAYYVTSSHSGLEVFTSVVGLAFTGIIGALMAIAIVPLKNQQKKGWVLLFLSWLVRVLAVVIGAILSFSFLGFVIQILFGAIFLAIGGYFIFEIHGQFNHDVKITKHTRKTS